MTDRSRCYCVLAGVGDGQSHRDVLVDVQFTGLYAKNAVRHTTTCLCQVSRRSNPYHVCVNEFENFLYSFGAARKLLERAFNAGSLIEALVLYVSLIDGLLRAALILREQLDADAKDFDFSYIEQKRGERRYSERKIYEEAFNLGLIDANLKSEIEDLYERRNAYVHRFFVTDIKYTGLESILEHYELVYHRCLDLVDSLEKRQLQTGSGMTTTGPNANRAAIADEVNSKIGLNFAKPATRPSDAKSAKPPSDPNSEIG